MGVLIMHRGSLRATPYQEWLAEYDGDAVLLASREQLAAHGERLPSAAGRFRHTEEMSDYDHGPPVARRAAELIEEHGLRRIVAVAEVDIGRAAALRDRYDLPGQRAAGAAVYRDKLLMKQAVEAAGIPVAGHRPVGAPDEITAFAAEHGLPVVVKPRTGAGSIGLAVLREEAGLRDFAAARAAAGDLRDTAGEAAWLAERFVPGTMFHIDGMVLDGRVVTLWPSHYRYALAAFAEDPGGRKDVALDPADPMTGRLAAFGERVLCALGGPPDFAFHIEVFHTPDDELVLCEAACRPGGAGIRVMHRAMFGLDPAEVMVRAQLGLPVRPLVDAAAGSAGTDDAGTDAAAGPAGAGSGRAAGGRGGHRLRPRRLAAQLLFMKRAGTVRSLPADDPDRFPWILRSQRFAAVGDRLGPAEHSGDFLLGYVLTAPDGRELDLRLDELESWVSKGLDVG